MCLQISSTDTKHFVFKYAGFYWGWKEFLLVDNSTNDNYRYQLLPSTVRGETYSIHQIADGLLIYPKVNATQPVEFIFNVVPEVSATFIVDNFKVATGIIGMELGCHISKIDAIKLFDFVVPTIEKFDYLEDKPELPARFNFSSFTCFADFNIQMVGDYDFVVSKFILPTPKLLDNFMSDVFQKFWAVNGKLALHYNKVSYEYFYDNVIKGE
jgi:hypothetical protein